MGDWDDARMEGFEAGVADAHHRERFGHHGGNALFVGGVHWATIAANLPGSRPEPIRPPTCSAGAISSPLH